MSYTFTSFESIVVNYYIMQELSIDNNFKNNRQKVAFEKIRDILLDKIFYLLRDTLFQMVFDELSHYLYRSEIPQYFGYICIEGDCEYDIYDLKNSQELYKKVFELEPITALHRASWLFQDESWEELYGGEAWARIADVLLEAFKKQNLNKTIWIEKVLYLAHNTGLAFNKDDTMVRYVYKDFALMLLDYGRDGKMIEKVKKQFDNHSYYEAYGHHIFIEKDLGKFVKTKIAKEERLILYIPKKYGNKRLILTDYEVDA